MRPDAISSSHLLPIPSVVVLYREDGPTAVMLRFAKASDAIQLLPLMSETRVWSPRENLVAIWWFLLVGPDSNHAIAEERTAESLVR
jgi:hypothetical protein